MERCDVLVVGGGPAGSSCAYGLRRHGLDVVVLDRREFPRDKVCAGWVTPPVFESLGVDLVEYARGRTLQPITGFRTGTIGGPPVETRYDEIVSYGILRREFDAHLLERSGARLRLGEPLESWERRDGEWLVNGTIRTPLLVAAGGHFCPVARRLRAERGDREADDSRVVVAQEAEYAPAAADLARCGVEPDRPELYFCPDLAGYGWCFRKGDYLNVGLGRVGADRLSDDVAAFEVFLRERGVLSGERTGPYRGHAYRLHGRHEPLLAADGIVLVGDGAGLAYAQSGEGIRPAVESGLIAADVIATLSPPFDEAKLAPYRERVLDRLGRAHRKRMVESLPHAWLAFAAGRLLRTHWFSRRVLLDQWFLHRDQPALVAEFIE